MSLAMLISRRSVRTYQNRPLARSEALLLAEAKPQPLGAARVRHLLVEGPDVAETVFTKLVGKYGVIIGAPALLVFIANTDDPGYMAAAGFMGQQLVMQAMELGLATCWVGGYFDRASTRRYVTLAPGEEILAVAAVGYPDPTSHRLKDWAMAFSVRATKRKPLAELVSGPVELPWLEAALEAARWAPSSHNGQPWRFTVEPGRVLIGHEPSGQPGPGGEDPRALDCGIAMANFAAVAASHGVSGSWRILEGARKLAEFRY